MISTPRWLIDDLWDRIFITFNDLADSTADTLTGCLWHMTRAVVASVRCIVACVSRATCMQNANPFAHYFAKCPLRGDEIKKSPRKVFRLLFRVARIHLRVHRLLFVPPFGKCFDEMFTYLCEAPFPLSFECWKYSPQWRMALKIIIWSNNGIVERFCTVAL